MIPLVKIGLSVLFLACLLPMPYSYFQIVRVIGLLGFCLLAYDAHDKQNTNTAIFFLVSAIVINPILKVPLGRNLWNLLDVIWASILLYQLKKLRNEH